VAISWVIFFLPNSISFGIFFKPILDEFGWSRVTLSLVQMVSMLVAAAASPFLGLLIDRVGPRIMLFISTATQTVASIITGLAPGLSMIYVGRILAEVRPTASLQVLINRWFLKKRGRAQGIVATGVPIGTFALIPLSQYLILIWDWRVTLLFWAGVIFVSTFILTWFIRDKPEYQGVIPDGNTLDTTASFPRIETSVAAPGTESGNTLAEAARTGAFWLVSGAHLICGIGCGFMMTHTVIFATDIGYSEMIGATFLSIQGIFNLAGVLLTGFLSDHVARNKALSLVHIIRSLSFATIIAYLVISGSSLWILYIAMALFGFGWFTTAPLTSGLVADLFGYRRMGTIWGVITAVHVVGMAIGVSGGGFTFELTHSYYWFFLVQGTLELVAACLTFAIRRVKSY
jgi:MFS family permease